MLFGRRGAEKVKHAPVEGVSKRESEEKKEKRRKGRGRE